MAQKNILERIPPKTLALGIATLLASLLLLLTFLVYFAPSFIVSGKMARILPYPVASIGLTRIITSSALGENMDAIRRFYQSQDFSKIGMRIDFSTTEGKNRLKIREKDLLNKMLEDEAIQKIAAENGIVVTPAEARAGVEGKLKELGTGTQVEESLARLYGWTLSDFEKKVVLPGLYQEKLMEKFNAEDNGKKEAEKKISEATALLKKGGTFTDVAGKYSEGQTANDGGELGWFAVEDLAPDLVKPVTDAKTNVPTDTVESSLGFHILLVTETKLEDGKRLYHLKQIFTKKPSFADWLSEKMRAMPIHIYSREYKWNAKDAQVDFRSTSLQDAEAKLREKAAGDPSLIL